MRGVGWLRHDGLMGVSGMVRRLLIAVAVVGVTSWWAASSDLTTLAKVVVAVAAVIASFAPSYVDWLIRRHRDRQRALTVPEPAPTGTLAGLLRADQRVVPFTGREAEYTELQEWCRDKKPPVRLVIGAGGVGKTRLAVELGDYLESVGWRVVAVSPGQEADALTRLRIAAQGPILLVVDYAETRTGLAELLRSVAADPVNVRVLLIARGEGDWWQQLRSDISSVRQLVRAYPPIVLSATLSEQPADQAELVRGAIPHFARRLGVGVPAPVNVTVAPGQAPLPLLVLHAAALVAVLRSTRPGDRPDERLVADYDVLGDLLGHESRYWSQASQYGPPGDLSVRRRAVAVACLFPAENEADAAELLRRVPDLAGDEAGRRKLARWLRELYPAGSGYWGYLQPELVGDYHVIEQVRDCPELVLADPTALRDEQKRQMLTVLSLATAHRPADQELLVQLLRRHLPALWSPALTVATASGGGLRPALLRVLASVALEPRLLRAIHEAIPHPTTQLARTAVVVARRVLRALPPGADPAQAAECLKQLGVREAQAGHTPEALRHLDMAVARYRELSATGDARYRPELARCLHLRALRCAEQDRRRDARNAAEEAVELFRTAPDPTGAYRPDLAACLRNLGVWTIERDRTRAAALLAEAVENYEELAELHRDEYLGELHDAQENLRRCESELHRPPEEPLDRLEEKVGHYRRRAAAQPDRYRPELARALHTLGNRYAEAGAELVKAEAALAEAVEIYRPLEEANRDRYRPELAGCLNDRGVVLAKLNRFPEAESSTSAAVARHRKLMKTNQRRYRPELARALDNLVELRVRAGRHAQALDPANEAVALHRRLAELKPLRYESELARALVNHSVCLSELHRHAEALPIAQEAERRYRQLDTADRAGGCEPRRYALRLAHALDNLAVDLAALRRHPEAEDRRAEARALRGRYSEVAA
jgi:hypothetical protein